jgi:HNH endonuclease
MRRTGRPRFRKLAEALQLFKCIYCLEERDRLSYTKVEHVLPQSFGKFEQNFTLQYVVCDTCNEYFGNNLEIHLGRDTYEGQLRFTHGVKDASDFKSPPGRHTRVTLKYAEGEFAGRFVARRFSKEKRAIEVTPLPQVGFLLSPTDRYEYFLLDDIPPLEVLQEKGFSGDRPRAIHGLAVDLEVLTQILGDRGIPFRVTDFDSPTDRPDTILCEFEGTIDHVIRRAVAKIAFNYLAKWQGAEFLHRREFDIARRYIRYGTLPDYQMMQIDEVAILEREPLEGPRVLGHIITTSWTDVQSVLSQVTLFNWLTYRISLSKEFAGLRPDIVRGHLFDGANRKIHELGSRVAHPG